MWAFSCFCGFASANKTGDSKNFNISRNGIVSSAEPLSPSEAAALPLLDVSNLSTEWACSQFPVACIALGEQRNGSYVVPQVTVLWHNATSLDVWDRLTNAERNPALMEAIIEIINCSGPAQQVVMVAGSTFAAQPAQPAAAAARFTSELLAAVSVPVHLSLVQFSTGPQGVVVPRALLVVCRAPLLPPRHADSGPGSRQLRSGDTAYQGPLREQIAFHAGAIGGGESLRVTSGLSASGVTPEGELAQQASMHESTVAAHRQRDSMVAAHLPAIITVFTLEGQVVHQNPASMQYMGPMPLARPHGTVLLSSATMATEDGGLDFGGAEAGPYEEGDWGSGLGVLGCIFTYEQVKLRQMMDVLLGRGNVWQGIVRVPASESLKQKLVYGRHPHQIATMEDMEGQGPEAGAILSAGAYDTLQPRPWHPTLNTSQAMVPHRHQAQLQQQREQQQQQPEDVRFIQQQAQRERLLEQGQAIGQRRGSEDPQQRWRSSEGIEERQQLYHHQYQYQQQQQYHHQQQRQEHQDHGRQPSPDSRQQQDRPAYQQPQQSQLQLHQETHQQQEQQQQQQQQQGPHFPSTLLDDGAASTQHSSGSFMLSGSRNNYRNSFHNFTYNNNNSSYQHQKHQQQQHQQPESGATTGEVLETVLSAPVPAPGSGSDSPRPRGFTKSSATNAYDREMDPLATSTWTVLADPASRGWPLGHHQSGPRILTTGFMDHALRFRARRISKRAQSTATMLDSPVDAREGEVPAGQALSLDLTRRWGSATQTAPPPLGRRLQALPTGLGSGPQTGAMLGGLRHHSQPHVTSGLGAGAGLALARRPGILAPAGGSLDTAAAAAVVATAVAAERTGEPSMLPATATSLLGRALRPISLPLTRRVQRSDDGGSASDRNISTCASGRRGEGSLTVPNAGAAVNPAGNGVASGAGSNTTGMSRVLVFANSLRSAPFAPATVAAPVGSLQTGSRALYDASGTGGGATVSGVSTHSPRPQSATVIRRQSRSYERGLALAGMAATPAPAPPSPMPATPQARISNATSPTAVQMPPPAAALDRPPSPPPVPMELTRPEISALTALLRARRSTLANAAGTASPQSLPPSMTPNAASSTTITAGESAAAVEVATSATQPAMEMAVPHQARFQSSGVLLLNPATRRSTVGDDSGSVPTGVVITAGEAELAMALLPSSQLEQPDGQISNLGTSERREGAEDAAGEALADEADDAVGSRPAAAAFVAASGEHDLWHEISAVSALDPVTGSAVLVVTQVDVTAKVRAERHLVHVMCAERRLLLQLFPRHVLQHVVEANPLLRSHTAAGASSLQSLPREWLDGGDWRPVLRDCDKLATMHPQATVLFADIAGFDDICMELPPQKVLAFLNDLFAKFDNSIEPFGVHKMETIGGLFIVAGGLLREEEDGAVAVRDRWDPLHAEKVFMFAKAMLNVAAKTKLPTLEEPVELRIGIHTGPVMSGIVGTRVPRFVLFGDTVNTASRMQTSATPGSVHVSEDTRALLPHENWTPTGGVQIKGKGLLHTYVWVPEDQIHYLVPPAVSTPESTQTGGGGTGNGGAVTTYGSGGAPTAAAGGVGIAVANGSRHGMPPQMLMSTMDTSSCTSSDVFLAQQLSFTSAIPPSLLRGKSRLRNEGGYLDD
ncbi:hypothetical protein VaNZ11_003498 [Volvox africanus]|uniref:Guanylate cyclase domain-containing protein n=1 Tax=Volvox africanus TaxID=51714 RepID=A0ABQ5RVX0_9CHLO|nr:hypothetical protein VaNZ11_003498 [Volvox africanus]